MQGLTIVIPAYNVEQYIDKCLDSVLSQACGHHNIHVIVVIDGATDNTASVARNTIARYPDTQTLFLIQENMGLSGARNTGLTYVTTEYVIFLDSDDFWLPGALETILTAIALGRYDVIEFDAIFTNEHGYATHDLKIAYAAPGTHAEISQNEFLAIFRCYAWARAYRTVLVRQRLFPVGHRFEDTLTTPWLYWIANEILSIGTPLVAYRQRDESILRSPTRQDLHTLNKGAAEALSWFRATNDEYWRIVAFRIFQQACSRVITLPFRDWLSASRIARANIANGLDTRGSLIRTFQKRLTLGYALLLYVKRRTLDRAKDAMRRRQFAHKERFGARRVS